jgi:hypothetical protein
VPKLCPVALQSPPPPLEHVLRLDMFGNKMKTFSSLVSTSFILK